jgi:hypothetical protein
MVDDNKIYCSNVGCSGIYTGPEFDSSGDVAHQFSNKISNDVGEKLKELFRSGDYSKVDMKNIVMTTQDMDQQGDVTYYVSIPFIKVTNPCDAYTSFDHVGGWGHTPELDRRKSELSKLLLPNDEFNISDLIKTPEGLQEYWIQWRNKDLQSSCATSTTPPQTITIKGKITDSSGSPLPNTSIKYAISPEIIFSEKEKQPIEFESGKGDDFLYKKDGDKFYFKGKPNTITAKKYPDWVEQTKDIGIAAIKLVYGEYKVKEIEKIKKSSPTVSSLETQSTPQGEYELKIEPTNFSPLGQVSYNLDDYQPETKSNLTINNNGTYVLNITLTPLANSVETQSKQAENEIQKQELEDLKNNLKAEIPTEEQLRKLLEQKKKTIIQILIPTLISLLLAFGVNAISNALSTKCPRPSFLKRIIRIRNNSATTLNGIYNTIKIVNLTLAGTQILLTSIQIGINIAEANPYPTPSKIASALVENKSRVRTLLGINTIMLFTISSLGIYLGVIKKYMDKLDALIQRCSEDEQIPFTEINNTINLQSPPPQSTDVNIYKGFTYEVVLDLSNNSPYPKRYAQALNKQGVPVLRTESSFASDAKVLVDQLKFIIDSNPNLTAE